MAGVHRLVLFDMILVVDCSGIFFVFFDVQGMSSSGASMELISPDGEAYLEIDGSGNRLRGIKERTHIHSTRMAQLFDAFHCILELEFRVELMGPILILLEKSAEIRSLQAQLEGILYMKSTTPRTSCPLPLILKSLVILTS
jgi:hypothetical protein